MRSIFKTKYVMRVTSSLLSPSIVVGSEVQGKVNLTVDPEVLMSGEGLSNGVEDDLDFFIDSLEQFGVNWAGIFGIRHLFRGTAKHRSNTKATELASSWYDERRGYRGRLTIELTPDYTGMTVRLSLVRASDASDLSGELLLTAEGKMDLEEAQEIEEEEPDNPGDGIDLPITGSDLYIGFVYKPVSESNGRLVVLLPPAFKGRVAYCGLANVTSWELFENGGFSGDEENGGRPHYRFDRPGSGYPGPIWVIVKLKSGGRVGYPIPTPSERYTDVRPEIGGD